MGASNFDCLFYIETTILLWFTSRSAFRSKWFLLRQLMCRSYVSGVNVEGRLDRFLIIQFVVDI